MTKFEKLSKEIDDFVDDFTIPDTRNFDGFFELSDNIKEFLLKEGFAL